MAQICEGQTIGKSYFYEIFTVLLTNSERDLIAYSIYEKITETNIKIYVYILIFVRSINIFVNFNSNSLIIIIAIE